MGELDMALSPVPGEELSTGLEAPDGLEVRARARVCEESCKEPSCSKALRGGPGRRPGRPYRPTLCHPGGQDKCPFPQLGGSVANASPAHPVPAGRPGPPPLRDAPRGRTRRCADTARRERRCSVPSFFREHHEGAHRDVRRPNYRGGISPKAPAKPRAARDSPRKA
jgi:hypothetical protein